MLKNQYLSTGLLALTVGVVGFGAGLATQGVDAHSENGEFKGPQIFESVDREITYLDNGVEIEITSDDAEVVEKIQERHSGDKPEREGKNAPEDAPEIDMEVEMIEDGVILTITTDDADAVERIQEHAENPKPHKGGHGEPHCEREEDDE